MMSRGLSKWAVALVAIGLCAVWAIPSSKADVTLEVNGVGVAFQAGEPVPPGSTTAFWTGALPGAAGFSVAAWSGSQSYQPPLTPIWGQLEQSVITLEYTGAGVGHLTLDAIATFTNAANYIGTPGTVIHLFSIGTSSADLGDSATVRSILLDGAHNPLDTLSGTITGTANPQNPTIVPVGSQQHMVYVPTHAFGDDQKLTITMASDTTMQLILTSRICNTPEPSSMAIAGLGVLGLFGYGIRRRRGA